MEWLYCYPKSYAPTKTQHDIMEKLVFDLERFQGYVKSQKYQLKLLAEGMLEAHKGNGDYEIDDYNHPDYETNNNRLPCICHACVLAREILK